jgi:hypothetical protein
MFIDPSVITINAIAQSLARTSMGVNSGILSKDDGTHRLSISHSLGKVNQRSIRLDRRSVVADPLTTGNFFETNEAVWLVSRTPQSGVSLGSQKQLVDGFLAFLTASSGANVARLLAGES